MSASKSRVAHVFIHRGASWYLPYALRTCRKSDPETPVMLIGEENVTPKVAFTSISEYETGYGVAEFNRHYVHLSTNAEDYEKFCFQRWFYLLEQMKRHDLEAVLYHDSDVLFLSGWNEVRDLYGGALDYAAFCILPKEHGRPVSGHSSYWSRQALQDFCQYLLDRYQDAILRNELGEMQRSYLEKHKSGGVCDMTLITQFVRNSSKPIGNLLAIHRGATFDHGVHMSDGLMVNQFRIEKGIKKIVKKGPDYYFLQNEGGQLIRALSLHFQGGYKNLIADYYRGGFCAEKFRRDIASYSPKRLLRTLEQNFRKVRKRLFGGSGER